jgi:hypothetical protein
VIGGLSIFGWRLRPQELQDNLAREQQLKRQYENIVGKLTRVESVHKQHSGDTEETLRRLRQVSGVFPFKPFQSSSF